MSWINKLKESFSKGSKKFTETTEEWVEKGKKAGEEGFEYVKVQLSGWSDRAVEASQIVKLKLDIGKLKKNLEGEGLTLGKLLIDHHRNKKLGDEMDPIHKQLTRMKEMDQEILLKNQQHDELRRSFSDDYPLNKLSQELSSVGGVVEMTVISEKSNVVDKLLKDILLPKDALISAIKREDEIIIPDGNTKLKGGDYATVIGKREDVEKVIKRLSA